MMALVREGDLIIVNSFSRLSRSTSDLLKIVEELNTKGVEFQSIKEKLDTTTATGKMQLTILLALAQYEREIMLERQEEGIRIAREKGVKFGRPTIDIPNSFNELVQRVEAKKITSTEAIKISGLSKSSYYRHIKQIKESERINNECKTY